MSSRWNHKAEVEIALVEDPRRYALEMVNAAGVDLHAPAVLTDAKACIGASHGAITGAVGNVP